MDKIKKGIAEAKRLRSQQAALGAGILREILKATDEKAKQEYEEVMSGLEVKTIKVANNNFPLNILEADFTKCQTKMRGLIDVMIYSGKFSYEDVEEWFDRDLLFTVNNIFREVYIKGGKDSNAVKQAILNGIVLGLSLGLIEGAVV